MIKDCDWTKPYCSVSHYCRDNIQYSITDYGNFVELMTYSWISYTLVSQRYFFKQKFEKDCVNDSKRYWNCGKNAIKYAKLFAEGIDNSFMQVCKDNMEHYVYKK